MRSNFNFSNDDATEKSFLDKAKTYVKVAAPIVAVGLGTFAVYRYRVASASEYVVRTGPLIGGSGISVSKKAFQWPFQTATLLTMAPR